MGVEDRLKDLGIAVVGMPVVLDCEDYASLNYLPLDGRFVFEGLSNDSNCVDEGALPQPRFCYRGENKEVIFSALFHESEISRGDKGQIVVTPSFDTFIMDMRAYHPIDEEYAQLNWMLERAEQEAQTA